MKNKIINTKTHEIVVVELPDKADKTLSKEGLNIFHKNGDVEIIDFGGTYNLLGAIPDITEVKASSIVEEYGEGYFPYPNEESTPLDTPIESLHYLLEANDILFENSFGEKPMYLSAKYCIDPEDLDRHDSDLSKWIESQEKVWDINQTHIFIKEK